MCCASSASMPMMSGMSCLQNLNRGLSSPVLLWSTHQTWVLIKIWISGIGCKVTKSENHWWHWGYPLYEHTQLVSLCLAAPTVQLRASDLVKARECRCNGFRAKIWQVVSNTLWFYHSIWLIRLEVVETTGEKSLRTRRQSWCQSRFSEPIRQKGFHIIWKKRKLIKYVLDGTIY